MGTKIGSSIRKVVKYIILLVIIIVILFPIYWIIASSVKYKKDLLTSEPKFIFKPTLSNYKTVLGRGRFVDGLINSLIVVPLSLVIGGVLGVPAAYAFARLKFKYTYNLKFWISKLRELSGDVPFIIIGNKIDLSEGRVIDNKTIKNKINEYGVEFYETSAKTNENVKKAMHFPFIIKYYFVEF